MGAKRALTSAQWWSTVVHHGCYWCFEKSCGYYICSENVLA
jgi:hypothetical protein